MDRNEHSASDEERIRAALARATVEQVNAAVIYELVDLDRGHTVEQALGHIRTNLLRAASQDQVVSAVYVDVVSQNKELREAAFATIVRECLERGWPIQTTQPALVHETESQLEIRLTQEGLKVLQEGVGLIALAKDSRKVILIRGPEFKMQALPVIRYDLE